MWIFTNKGFFSVVQKSGEDLLTVRARVKQDLENFLKFYLQQQLPITESKESDYRFRVRISREDFSRAVIAMVEDLTYPNFKDSVYREQSPKRELLYEKLWSILRSLQT